MLDQAKSTQSPNGSTPNGLRPAIAVGVLLDSRERADLEEHLDELALLADTAGFEIVARVVQERRSIDPATFIGSGKVDEIANLAEALNAEAIIFDDELSPAQGRNLEEAIKKPVTDRTGIILDIFAQRARTREARTQVELARLQYILPRLTGMWSHFTRQRGGVGMRGEGETQLEMDRRMTKARIAELRRELEEIRKQAETRRKGRVDAYKVSLVGYTNAGKSTLMNALTEAGVLAENRLFATLDATMRTLDLPSGEQVLLTDTVGFIRKLPTNLVASFRSTLDEILDANLILHVVDVSHRAYEDHIHATNQVLAELGASDKPMVMVFNKIDMMDGQGTRTRLKELYPDDAVVIAAKTGQGLDDLLRVVQRHFEGDRHTVQLRLSPSQHKAVALLHQRARVLSTDYDEDGNTILTVLITPKDLGQVAAEAGHALEPIG